MEYLLNLVNPLRLSTTFRINEFMYNDKTTYEIKEKQQVFNPYQSGVVARGMLHTKSY